MLDKLFLRSKFRGCLLGALVGDCCGAPFEGELMDNRSKSLLRNNLDKLEGPYFKAPYKKYTDDTAMTICMARTFLDPQGYSQSLLARNFVIEYFKDPNRGYGAAVGEVFMKLKKSKISDPVAPAREQFGGSGSYGNGSAMRVSPIPLYALQCNKTVMIKLVQDTATITHAHILGINGAILQALAIRQCLYLNPEKGFDWLQYLTELKNDISEIEKTGDILLEDHGQAYQKQLGVIEQLLEGQIEPNDENVLNLLGHSVEALYSVPTAIYCFLLNTSQKGVNSTQKEHHAFRQTLEYAISLGGDTDTIASMACAISGAYFGESVISENILKHCEGTDVIKKCADDLLELQKI
ncbi:ADP-ribosylhydrolase ARH3-like [Uranotaenia lowii]|uniref:ADP-ribosylhydrolase ARH3-like n=1 Tax=Uranotaenia lowii TaxID=190385 RepID=UPI00247AD40D|nr:ADP-ribosylhydrolase ARH3-like [Uranotaenia lowii]